MKKIGVIIPAGGAGTRMGSGSLKNSTTPPTLKQFAPLGGVPMLARVIEGFRRVAAGADIVVALPADRFDEWARLCMEHDVPPHKVCEGGATRFLSVQGALADLDADCEYIAVHDAARPLVSTELILRTFETARRHGSAIPVVALTDSVRRLNGDSSYPEDRAVLRGVQTPQVFRADILRAAYEKAAGDGFTDDATVVESVGYTVMLCEGERRNIKVTEPDDLIFARSLFER